MSSDLTILQGPSVVEDVLDFVDVPREKLVVAPTGVDDMQQLLKKSRNEVRRYWNTPFSSRVFVTVGSLDRNKNQSAIIEAFSRLSDESAYLWIVGTGVMAADWEHYSAELGVAERVRFMGNRNDLADIYTAADVYVHAAWYDNFPNVYLEAMVCGLPLIGPRGEFPDVISPLDGIIEEKVHGVSYSLRQRDGLEGAMKYMLDRPEEELTEMGRRARVLALDAFSWEKYQSQLLQAVSMRNAEVIYES
ncbi:hypothetical protein GSUB_08050 [Geoalkalibacter subterraneus]|uniref:Glycosyl transferase family 1 domain-containing protein n=2 Tax=Geoalkalibacter subterraneus TaxID=483547 RepID=A0A0B5FSC3_9BACT|nr:hypothetical protein GSUB_08050 [Geoalkalibacter subterraneus]